MTSSIPRDIDDLLVRMQIVSAVPNGGKIDFSVSMINSGGYFGTILRTLRGESREKMCEEAKRLTEDVCTAILEKKDSPFHNVIVSRAVDLKESLGRQRDTTYKNDILVSAKLNNCIDLLRVALDENVSRD